jgi:HJR/Mrr/RecB family endonuclease
LNDREADKIDHRPPRLRANENIVHIEDIRGKLLAMEPRNFELFIKGLLQHCGFSDVCVTRYSTDGGVDVNARAGGGNWAFENILVQIQAKRWLHS